MVLQATKKQQMMKPYFKKLFGVNILHFSIPTLNMLKILVILNCYESWNYIYNETISLINKMLCNLIHCRDNEVHKSLLTKNKTKKFRTVYTFK